MIWRLAHPVRAMVTFALVFVGLLLLLAAVFGGFGIGPLEVLLVALVAIAAASLANREAGGLPEKA